MVRLDQRLEFCVILLQAGLILILYICTFIAPVGETMSICAVN
jgi:hypothetical protein